MGAGGQARRLIGTVTITGMFFSTAFAIFLIPALFVIVERLSHRFKGKPLEPSATEGRASAQVRQLHEPDKGPLRSPGT